MYIVSDVTRSAMSAIGALHAGKFASSEAENRFQKVYRDDGLIPVTFAVLLGLLVSIAIYLVGGVLGFDSDDWLSTPQLHRLSRTAFLLMFLAGILLFWRHWQDRSHTVAYAVLVVAFGIGPMAMLTADASQITQADGWRSIASQMICIVIAFSFLRLPLIAIVVAAIPSAGFVVLRSFPGSIERLVSATMLTAMIVTGIGIWLNHYWRERRLFQQALQLESAARTERELADASQQARRSLIHDIRQPMAAVSIHLGLLETSEKSDPDLVNKRLATLSYAFNALSAQVDDFARESFDPQRFAGKSFPIERINVGQVVSNGVRLQEPLARIKNINLTFKQHQSDLIGIGRSNPMHLANVIQLLLSNAIKFNQNVRIRVSCKITETDCFIYVIDTGKGIPPDDIEFIFREGFSTGAPGSESQGLGLFNVKRIIENLPLHSLRVRSKEKCYTAFQIRFASSSSMPGIGAPRLSGESVLVVDDEPIVASSLAALFEGVGATVHTAYTPQSAFDVVRDCEEDFSLLVCDFNIGASQTGVSIIEEIRQQYGFSVPALVVTGRAGELPELPMSIDVIEKPIVPNEILHIAATRLGVTI